MKLSVVISYFEIYCGKLYDLINDKKLLHAREDFKNVIQITGLKEISVGSTMELMNLIEIGNTNRVVGVSATNDESSRSHAVLSIKLIEENGSQRGKLTFIDLAGSEKASEGIETDKQTKLDGAEINKSLLALKECIRAMDQQKSHTPFRGSKLTMVLKDSFTGDCQTLMIGSISPSSKSIEHTLNTLRYAERVKEFRGSMSSQGRRGVTKERELLLSKKTPTKRTASTHKIQENRSMILRPQSSIESGVTKAKAYPYHSPHHQRNQKEAHV